VIVGLIRQKGEKMTGMVRILGGGNLSGGKGEGDIIIPDVWVLSRWDSRGEDWVRSEREPVSCRPSF
jgi:hypothetical protein